VPASELLAAGWREAVRSRLPWLYVNLLTAFLAGGVVYIFQSTVQRTVALAVWMPIIAGMGGNAGTQALAVTVRRLALGQMPSHLFARVVGKEVLVGMVNGLAIGGVVGLVALLMGEQSRLGAVVFLAMTGNLLVAGFAGGSSRSCSSAIGSTRPSRPRFSLPPSPTSAASSSCSGWRMAPAVRAR